MSLRLKCAILIIAFELTLAVTLFATVRVIRHYFEDAAQSISNSSQSSVKIRRLRRLLRDEFTQMQLYPQLEPNPDERARMMRDIDFVAAEVLADKTLDKLIDTNDSPAASSESLKKLLAQRQLELTTNWKNADGTGDSELPFVGSAHLALDRLLGQWEALVFDHLSATARGSFDAFYRSVLVLSVNMVVGALLGVIGLVLVRRWVLLPVIELTDAADQFGRGHLDHRAQVRTEGELGQLATAFNGMAADIARLNRQMVYRERAAVMGELISYIAHNIRNPLAGIRSLAESCRRTVDADDGLARQHDEIVGSVERLQSWLREVEHVCRPMEMQIQTVEAAQLIEGVVRAFRPMALRREIDLQVTSGDEFSIKLSVDTTHFEQALAAIVGNAIEACDKNGVVTIAVESCPAKRQNVVSVTDSGPGISEALKDKVFQPSISSKRDGSGLGLTMARRVAALHGGELTYECPPEGGTIFKFTLPMMEVQDRADG